MIIIITPFRVFHTSISRSFLIGVWVTASLFKSLWLFSVFWLISSMLSFGQSPHAPLFPSPLVLLPSFGDCTKSTNYNWYNRHSHVPQLFQFPSKVQVLILLFGYFQFYSVVSWNSKVHIYYCYYYFFRLFCFSLQRYLSAVPPSERV